MLNHPGTQTETPEEPIADTDTETPEEPMANTDTVRDVFDAYLAQDRDATERLLAEDFTFTSLQDDHIGKAAYLKRCFPTADRLVSRRILELVSAGGSGVSSCPSTS